MHAVISIEYQIPILQEGTTNSKVGRVVHDVTSIEHEGILVLLDGTNGTDEGCRVARPSL